MVFKFSNNTPDWLYHKANFSSEKLPALQTELLQAFEKSKEHSLVPYTSTYGEVSPDFVKKTCPRLCKQLMAYGLFHYLKAVAFVSVVHDKFFEAHVDGGENVALNIPLINCAGTYTVWYNGAITQKSAQEYLIGHASVIDSKFADEASLVEIGRVECIEPYWLNVNIIHRPLTTHTNFRVAASVRFVVDPIDEQGNLWSHLVKPPM